MVSRGSQWRRWEPHIHTPGTVLNNQFGGSDAWETYLTTLEGVTPKIEALAVTDYYVTDTYEEVRKHKASGRLTDVELIFPNIEIRLDVAAKSGFVNVHLLVSPEDTDHLVQLRRILNRLQFHAHGDRFDCTRDDLIALGKRADPNITDDRAALLHGATQFKVNFDQLRRVFHESDWAKKNILIAVAGSAGDGTSGVRQAADTTMRQEIEKFAHIIFSSSPAQREFWLGQRNVTTEALRERYNGCKPCLHGSDSHDLKTVGQPADDRFSWIKGGLEFDALRQACIASCRHTAGDLLSPGHTGILEDRWGLPFAVLRLPHPPKSCSMSHFDNKGGFAENGRTVDCTGHPPQRYLYICSDWGCNVGGADDRANKRKAGSYRQRGYLPDRPSGNLR